MFIQPIHLILIAIVAFIIFGPKHLPQIGKSIAKAVRDLRSGMKGMGEEFHEEFEKPPTPTEAAQPVTAQSAAPASPAIDGPTCTKCGAANPPASRFCHKCGQQLIKEVA